MYDTDEETEADQYSSTLCMIRTDESSDSVVEVLQATAEHVLERLEVLSHEEPAALEAAVRIAYFRFPRPGVQTPTERDMVQLLIEERIMSHVEYMEQDVRYIIQAASGGWQRPPMLKFTELHEILVG